MTEPLALQALADILGWNDRLGCEVASITEPEAYVYAVGEDGTRTPIGYAQWSTNSGLLAPNTSRPWGASLRGPDANGCTFNESFATLNEAVEWLKNQPMTEPIDIAALRDRLTAARSHDEWKDILYPVVPDLLRRLEQANALLQRAQEALEPHECYSDGEDEYNDEKVQKMTAAISWFLSGGEG